MIDLDAKIRSLVERNIPRKDIVSELDAIASDAESRAKRFERAKKKGDRYRAESERALSARVGRILFFLHHGVPAQGATDADLQLYDLLNVDCSHGQQCHRLCTVASAELLDFGLEHRLRSAPLSGAGGERDHAGHRQPMPVFHRGV